MHFFISVGLSVLSLSLYLSLSPSYLPSLSLSFSPWAPLAWPTRGGAVLADDPPNREKIHPLRTQGIIDPSTWEVMVV